MPALRLVRLPLRHRAEEVEQHWRVDLVFKRVVGARRAHLGDPLELLWRHVVASVHAGQACEDLRVRAQRRRRPPDELGAAVHSALLLVLVVDAPEEERIHPCLG